MKNRMNVPEVYEPVLPGKVEGYIAKQKAAAAAVNDLRAQLPECPLAYEVPFIPGDHTALVMPITLADLDWQEKMLPWTLASLINNTDMILKGVHLYIACDAGTEDRVKTALKSFDLPESTIFEEASVAVSNAYAHICFFDINYWAFRDAQNTHKLASEHILTSDAIGVEPYPDIAQLPPEPGLYDMQSSTTAQFRHAIKHLMGAQLSMKV